MKLDLKHILLKRFASIAKYRFALFGAIKSLKLNMQYLPGNSRFFGPPRGIYENASSYNQKNTAAEIKEIVFKKEEYAIRYLPVTNSNLVKGKFGQYLTPINIEKVAYILPKARYIYGNGGTVVTKDDKVFFPVSPLKNEWDYKRHQSLALFTLPKLKRLEKVILIDTRASDNNYYHWVKDHLSRFYWLIQLNINFAEYSLVCSHGTLPFQKFTYQFLKENGYTFKEWLDNKHYKHFYADEIIIPPYSTKGLTLDKNTVDISECQFIKKTFSRENVEMKIYERFYISRRKSNRASPQETDLVKRLAVYDVKEIFLEDYNLSQTIHLFSNAKVIIGFHGAGLTNIMFSKSETIVVELFGPNFIMYDYWAIANQFNLKYYAYCNDELKTNNVAHRVGRLMPAEIIVDSFINFFEDVLNQKRIC